MTRDGNSGAFGHLTQNTGKVWRLLRRAYHERTESGPIDPAEIERQMLVALYRKAARELGLESFTIGRVLCLSGQGKTFRIWRTTSEFDHGPLWAITEDKLLTKSLFQERGLLVPEGRGFARDDADAAIKYAVSLGRPCVVKPALDTSSGQGVTTNLTERREIRRAFRLAALFAPQVLIEEFIPGDNYRFLVYKGKCLAVARRDLPGVTGNGVSSVRELAARENQIRVRSSHWCEGDPMWMPLPLKDSASRHLKHHGLDWSYVPKTGERVHLAGTANYGFGCSYTEVLHQTHPEQIRVAQEAAVIIGMDLAGVDIISPDIGTPAYRILEINGSPGIVLHYMASNPETITDPIRTILADYFGIAKAESAG